LNFSVIIATFLQDVCQNLLLGIIQQTFNDYFLNIAKYLHIS